jgi:nucleoside-diphosphate-sugar epimerase
MTIRRVLVTGATGFIGRWAVVRLREMGAEVHAVTHHAAGAPADALSRDVVWHRADLHDAAAVQRLCASVRAPHLLHAAWYVEPRDYLTSHENLRWVGATLQLAEAFRDAGGERMVGVGTSAEYGPSPGPCRELATPLAPATLYAASKRAVHDVLERWSAQTGVSFAWGRVFNLHGPFEAPSRLVPQLVRAGVTGTAFAMRFPAQRRDYLHVADTGGAIAALLASPVTGAVNIASGEPVALAELAREVAHCLGGPLTLAPATPAVDPAPTLVADVSRLRNDVGFMPQYTRAAGLADSAAWWSQWWKTHGDPVLT